MTPRRGLLAVAALTATLVASGCTASDNGGGGRPAGPLLMPEPFSGVMAAAKRASYFTVDGCLRTEAGAELEVLEVQGLEPWSEVDLIWKVAWPDTANPILRGSGRGAAPEVFELLPSRGFATSCMSGETSPVLAVEFPIAKTEDVGFETLRVRYKVGDKEYDATYKTRVGICAVATSAKSPSPCAS